jgi:hypothetical protein
MQRIISLVLVLMLSGCSYKTWWNPAFVSEYNPNAPSGESENIYRVRGQDPSVPLLTTEAGDIWPGPLTPPPTLKDLEASGGTAPQSEAPLPGSPLDRGSRTSYPSQSLSIGSSASPLGNAKVGFASHQPVAPVSGYQTTTTPGGGQSIIVPNGNGTSTVIHPDGRIETVPTSK